MFFKQDDDNRNINRYDDDNDNHCNYNRDNDNSNNNRNDNNRNRNHYHNNYDNQIRRKKKYLKILTFFKIIFQSQFIRNKRKFPFFLISF